MNLSVEFVPGSWDGDQYTAPKLIIKALTGTFEEAKPAIEKFLAELGANDVELVMDTPIESHQGDHGHLHVGTHTHA